MYGTIIKVHYFDSLDNKEKFAYYVGSVNNLVEAAEKVEQYFGEDLISVEFEFITEWGCSLIEVPESAVSEIRKLNEC